jgi:uncharacterized phage-like protein YoqJ
MIVAATGHRPDKLGGYSMEVFGRLRALASEFLGRDKPDKVLTGMALGWDQAVAAAAIENDVPFVAAVPCEGQDSRWPVQSRAMYKVLLERADEVVVVSPGPYAAWKMMARNKWMVDKAELVVALWDGSDGGTANCVRYAESRGIWVENLWGSWVGRNDEA